MVEVEEEEEEELEEEMDEKMGEEEEEGSFACLLVWFHVNRVRQQNNKTS